MQWFNIVKWVNFALIDAEEMGVGSKTIDEALKSQKPASSGWSARRATSASRSAFPTTGRRNAIRAVGNYGEVFDRNVGVHTKLGIPRGLNELWNNGGIQYAPPIR